MSLLYYFGLINSLHEENIDSGTTPRSAATSKSIDAIGIMPDEEHP
ncbi:MAG: hypothetical protein PUA61_05505 [Succinatimonas hippei]|nr:hypothetical protein [Succinatimonas hippei]